MEKAEQLCRKRRIVMEKTGSYGKDGHKAFKTVILSLKRERGAHSISFINTD